MSRKDQASGQAPVKITMSGVEPGSPLARAIYDRIGGEVNHFYSAARQQVDIPGASGLGQQKGLADGSRLRYTYNNGLETLDISVSPKTKAEAEEQVKKSERTAWDWLVIDLEIPVKDTSAPPRLFKLTSAARFYRPALADIAAGDPPTPIFGGASLERFAVDEQGANSGQQEPVNADEQANPRLMWAIAPRAEQLAAPEVETDNNLFKCSLLVDIRPNFWVDQIEVDIWAQLDVWEVSKDLKGIIVRSPDIDPTLTYWFGDATLHYTEAGVADYLATVDSSLAAGVTNEVFHGPSIDLNRWIPYPYTYSNLTDNIVTDVSQFTMSGLTWLNNNRSATREIYGNQFSTLWRDPTSPYVWADGFWDQFTWSEFDAALDELSAASGVINFSGPISALGVNVATMEGGRFWAQLHPPHGFIWGFGDPGTPPPTTVGFDAEGDSTVGSATFGFFNVWNTYIFKPRISTLSTSTLVTTDCAIKAVALKGQFLDPPSAPGSSDAGQLMWTERDCTIATDILTAVTPGSTQNWRYGQWEQKGRYPNRWTMNLIDGAEAVPVDNQDGTADTADIINNMKFLGRVKFDQTGGGASFSWTRAADIPADKRPEMPA